MNAGSIDIVREGEDLMQARFKLPAYLHGRAVRVSALVSEENRACTLRKNGGVERRCTWSSLVPVCGRNEFAQASDLSKKAWFWRPS